VGSRSTTARTNINTPAPVDVISTKELKSFPQVEIGQILNYVAPSFSSNRQTISDGSDHIDPASLRGLTQVLVLVNGKRRHMSSLVNINGSVGRGSVPTDLSAIPVSAIERIEVLRDGAAAQYGSDAIAGVINIILKKGAAGGEVQVGVGQFSEGDGRQGNFSANFGTALGEKGWLRVTAEQRNQNETNRAGADLRNPAEPLYGKVTQLQGDPKTRQSNLGINAVIPLENGVELYSFASASRRATDAAATWRTAYTSTTGTTLRSPLYPQGFLPIEASTATDLSFITGLRGNSDGWRWDSSLNLGSSEFDLNVEHTANLSLGAASPTKFHAGNLKTLKYCSILMLPKSLKFPGFLHH